MYLLDAFALPQAWVGRDLYPTSRNFPTVMGFGSWHNSEDLSLKGRLFPEISRLLGLTADAPSLPTPLQGALIPARQGPTDAYYTPDGLLTSPLIDRVKSPNLIKRRINCR